MGRMCATTALQKIDRKTMCPMTERAKHWSCFIFGFGKTTLLGLSPLLSCVLPQKSLDFPKGANEKRVQSQSLSKRQQVWQQV